MTAALEAAETGEEGRAGREAALSGRARQPAVQVLPQVVPSDLRAGDQPAPGQDEPQPDHPDDGRGDEHRGEAGAYTATVKLAPRHVNDNCTGCGDCGKAVEAEFDDEYNYGMSKRNGAYLPHVMAHRCST